MDIADQLSAEEARVIGALIEKGATTPDNYPLSSNALVAACNQSTSRDPVMDLSEREVDSLMLELRQRGLARTLTGAGHRVPKHRHVVHEALGLDGDEIAVLAVMFLRGAQTLNEITTRTERYSDGPEGDPDRVNAAIDRLATREEPLALRLGRQPGEREPRIDQIWSPSSGSDQALAPVTNEHDREHEPATNAPVDVPTNRGPDLHARIEVLEASLAEQTRRLDELIRELEG